MYEEFNFPTFELKDLARQLVGKTLKVERAVREGFETIAAVDEDGVIYVLHAGWLEEGYND